MLGSLIAAFLSGETAGLLSRARRSAILMGFAALTGVVGCVFLIVAGYIAAARRWGPIEAALAFGVGFILVAILLLLINLVLSRGARKTASTRRRSEIVSIATAAGIGMLPALLKGRGSLGTLLVPLAGLAAYALYRENSRPSGDDDKPG